MIIPQFKNQKLFDLAFTHRSYLNESPQKTASNERLEFLGDSILSFVVSNHLYIKYPDYDEGMLTNVRSLLVNTKSLAEAAKQLNFGQHLRLSRGEEESHGRQNQSLLADSFEAFIGALFLDQGLGSVTTFIEESLLEAVPQIIEKKAFKDPKSLLQEYMQAHSHESPVYTVVKEEGPSHAKRFTISVSFKGKVMGEGSGKSKQEAEAAAAQLALEKIHKE